MQLKTSQVDQNKPIRALREHVSADTYAVMEYRPYSVLLIFALAPKPMLVHEQVN
jgi:hypothetical protein